MYQRFDLIDNDDEQTVLFLLQQGANSLIKNQYNEIASDLALTYSPIHQILKNDQRNKTSL